MMTTGFLADGPAGFAQQHNSRWLLTAYEAGDVVFHKPHMIHASTINQDPENRIRLGTDLRFVNASRPYDSVSAWKLFLSEALADANTEMVQAIHI